MKRTLILALGTATLLTVPLGVLLALLGWSLPWTLDQRLVLASFAANALTSAGAHSWVFPIISPKSAQILFDARERAHALKRRRYRRDAQYAV
jgi:hypothetical protein